MPDLNFQVEGAEVERFAAAPVLRFPLRVTESGTSKQGQGAVPTPIHSVVLRCQIRIEPGRRTYTAAEKERLGDLFGTPERWGQTVRPMLWTHIGAVVPPFTGAGAVDLSVPCTADFNLAAAKYFEGLEGGEIPLCFLFSGTIFYEDDEGALQVEQISWEKEAHSRLPSATWRGLMDLHYPNSAWLNLRKDVFDRLARFRRREGLPTWEHALERLLAEAEAEEPVAP